MALQVLVAIFRPGKLAKEGGLPACIAGLRRLKIPINGYCKAKMYNCTFTIYNITLKPHSSHRPLLTAGKNCAGRALIMPVAVAWLRCFHSCIVRYETVLLWSNLPAIGAAFSAPAHPILVQLRQPRRQPAVSAAVPKARLADAERQPGADASAGLARANRAPECPPLQPQRGQGTQEAGGEIS